MQKRKVTLEPGTLILCWHCHAAFLKLVQPLSEGDEINYEKLRYVLKDEGPFRGEVMECTECRARFNNFTKLYLPIPDSIQYTV